MLWNERSEKKVKLKAERVSSDIVKEISNIILREVHDTDIKKVTITYASVTNDLSFAKVYFTSISDLSNEQMEKELNEASSFIRTELASKIELRIVPKLKFVYDESIEYGNKIESILQELKEEKDHEWNFSYK